MNKTKIEFCDYTWNPITGCTHNCPYCYAKRMATRFSGSSSYPKGFHPTFHENRLIEPSKIKKPSKIFVGSMGDLFCESFSDDTIMEVLLTCLASKQHTFMFLTKNPKRYLDFCIPKNCWLGFSASNTNDYQNRISYMQKDYSHNITFASLEPLQEEIVFDGNYPDWLIIGAETGNRKEKIVTEYIWISSMVNKAVSKGVRIFLKDNLNLNIKIQEFPEVVK